MTNLTTFVQNFHKYEVLVVGDLILDDYLCGTVERISPEAPVPIVSVTSQSSSLGGAANVFHNILTLGGKATLCGIVGSDESGQRLYSALEACCHENSHKGTLAICKSSTHTTPKKTRIIANSQQIARVDIEEPRDIAGNLEAQVIEKISDHIMTSSCVVVSDYAKGVITPPIMKNITRIASQKNIPVIVDPKVKHFSRYQGVTMLTPNQREAILASGLWPPSTTDKNLIGKAGKTIIESQKCKCVLITQGENGMTIFEDNTPPRHIQTTARPVFDVTGAGDTVIATLALAVSAGTSFHAAATLATLAAGIVVGKAGTSTVSHSELLEASSSSIHEASP